MARPTQGSSRSGGRRHGRALPDLRPGGRGYGLLQLRSQGPARPAVGGKAEGTGRGAAMGERAVLRHPARGSSARPSRPRRLAGIKRHRITGDAPGSSRRLAATPPSKRLIPGRRKFPVPMRAGHCMVAPARLFRWQRHGAGACGPGIPDLPTARSSPGNGSGYGKGSGASAGSGSTAALPVRAKDRAQPACLLGLPRNSSAFLIQ